MWKWDKLVSGFTSGGAGASVGEVKKLARRDSAKRDAPFLAQETFVSASMMSHRATPKTKQEEGLLLMMMTMMMMMMTMMMMGLMEPRQQQY